MGTGPDDRRSVGTRIRRRRYPPVHGGGLDAAVLAVSQQCGSSHRRDEKGGVDHAQPRKRFQRTAHSRGASLFTWPARTHGQESSLVAAPARTDNQETSLVAAPGSAVLTGGARDASSISGGRAILLLLLTALHDLGGNPEGDAIRVDVLGDDGSSPDHRAVSNS